MSTIIQLQDANSAELEIYKQNNRVHIVLTEEIYNMLSIECKLTIFDLTTGRSLASVVEIIKGKRVIATINTAPMAKDLPTH